MSSSEKRSRMCAANEVTRTRVGNKLALGDVGANADGGGCIDVKVAEDID